MIILHGQQVWSGPGRLIEDGAVAVDKGVIQGCSSFERIRGDFEENIRTNRRIHKREAKEKRKSK